MARLHGMVLFLAAFSSVLFLQQTAQAQVYGNTTSRGPQLAPRVTVGGNTLYLFRNYSYGLPESFQSRSMPNPLRFNEMKNMSSFLGESRVPRSLPALAANRPLVSRLNERTQSLFSASAPFQSSLAGSFPAPSYTSAANTNFPTVRTVGNQSQLASILLRENSSVLMPRSAVSRKLIDSETAASPLIRPNLLSNLTGRFDRSSPAPNLLMKNARLNPIHRGLTGNNIISPYHTRYTALTGRLALLEPR